MCFSIFAMTAFSVSKSIGNKERQREVESGIAVVVGYVAVIVALERWLSWAAGRLVARY
jgi:hypothetical protein